MDLIFGYDIMTYNGPLPNCLNPKFIETIYDGSNYDYNKSHHYFHDKTAIINQYFSTLPQAEGEDLPWQPLPPPVQLASSSLSINSFIISFAACNLDKTPLYVNKSAFTRS